VLAFVEVVWGDIMSVVHVVQVDEIVVCNCFGVIVEYIGVVCGLDVFVCG